MNELQIRNKVEFILALGLGDPSMSVDDYMDLIRKIQAEKDEKEKITDQLIEYNDEIISIEDVGDQEVIDITVTGDNLFYCNDILTKNSIGLAATADVITSIYQSDEDREMNIIRFGMMKNRFGPNGQTQPMRIDYSTLTITQSDEDIVCSSDSTFSTLELFGKH